MIPVSRLLFWALTILPTPVPLHRAHHQGSSRSQTLGPSFAPAASNASIATRRDLSFDMDQAVRFDCDRTWLERFRFPKGRKGSIFPVPDHAGERRLFPRPAIPGCENGHAPIDDRLTLQSGRDCKGVGTAISRQLQTLISH